MNHYWKHSPYLLSLALATGAVCALPAAPAAAQVTRSSGASLPGMMGIPQPEPLINLKLENKSLPRILFEVFKQTPYQYRVPTSTGAQLFTLDATKLPLTQALDQLIAQDKSPEPLVYYFTKSVSGPGVFTIDREYMELSDNDGDYRISLTNARITKVLPELFKKMNIQKFRIEPDVPPIPISMQLRPAKWQQALPLIILEAYKQEPTLTYSQDKDGTYIVHLQRTSLGSLVPGASVTGQRRVQFQVADKPLREAVSQALTGSTWKYEVAGNVPDTRITYTAQGETEMSALRNILHQASAKGEQVTYREGKGILYIELGPLPGEQPVVIEKKPEGPRITSVSPNKQRLYDVVKNIATLTATNIRVSPNVPNLPVTFMAEGTAEEIMTALVESAKGVLPNLSFHSEGGSKENFVLELGDAKEKN